MSARRCLVAISLASCMLAGASSGVADGATPGAISGFHLASPCPEGSIGAALREGVLVRQCQSLGKSSVGNLLPNGQLVPLGALEADAGPLLAGPNDEVWVAANSTDRSAEEPVGILRIAGDGGVQRFPFSEQGNPGSDAKPAVRGMVIGTEGALWAAVGYGATENVEWYGSIGGELARVTQEGVMTEFPAPDGVEPLGLALGAEGDLWFTAVRGLSATEHTYSPGAYFIGRITPTGETSLFSAPPSLRLTAITAAPDGTLWFGDSEGGRIGTIDPDGRLGRVYRSVGMVPKSLAFGREGDLWAAGSGLVRVTPAGQRTRFGEDAESVAIGPEGKVWAQSDKRTWNVVPGAPGIDLWDLTAEPRSKAVEVRLACGGSTVDCRGAFEISLPRSIERPGAKHGRKGSTYRVARRHYRVPAESSRVIRVKIAPRILADAVRYGHEHSGEGPPATVKATVNDGPSMLRWSELRLPTAKPQAGSAARDAK